MITITLTDETVHKFNLKNFEREFAMHTAWYAMSDSPKFAMKQIKVTTDRGVDLVFKVGEIRSCAVEDRTYEYDEPVVLPKKEEKKAPDDIGNFEEEMRRMMTPGNPEMASLMDETIASVGDETHKKAYLFMEGLRRRNITIDLNDVHMHMTMMETIQDSIENVEKHIDEYVKYREERDK